MFYFYYALPNPVHVLLWPLVSQSILNNLIQLSQDIHMKLYSLFRIDLMYTKKFPDFYIMYTITNKEIFCNWINWWKSILLHGNGQVPCLWNCIVYKNKLLFEINAVLMYLYFFRGSRLVRKFSVLGLKTRNKRTELMNKSYPGNFN